MPHAELPKFKKKKKAKSFLSRMSSPVAKDVQVITKCNCGAGCCEDREEDVLNSYWVFRITVPCDSRAQCLHVTHPQLILT